MEANTASALREDLVSQQTSLRHELEELGFGSEGLSYDPNFADSSQVTAERGETEALVTTLTTNLVDVEHALAKMDAGNYGTCESCHQEIVPARLEAMPAARYCISCAARRR
jgi:DnaK suppressor protein